ncbi:amino acid transporter, partial [Francisella tularensis subsp. holarctica]|nr:amino acid transporter [Francisella tularensis subsp. holarctica]
WLIYYFKKLFLIAVSIVGLLSLIMMVSSPLYMVRILRKRNYQIIYKSMQNSQFNNLALLSAAVIIIFLIVEYIL